MSKKYVPVRFLRNFANYNAGEVAGFSPARAEAMVAGKVAEMYKPGSAAKPKAKAKPAKPADPKPAQQDGKPEVF